MHDAYQSCRGAVLVLERAMSPLMRAEPRPTVIRLSPRPPARRWAIPSSDEGLEAFARNCARTPPSLFVFRASMSSSSENGGGSQDSTWYWSPPSTNTWKEKARIGSAGSMLMSVVASPRPHARR